MSKDIATRLNQVKSYLPQHVTLVAVSKTKPTNYIQEAYNAGQRDFGENKAQEILEKATILPRDIKWHFIGHLQSKKVKQIISYTDLIHSVDSLKLLEEINKRAGQINKIQEVLIQVYIAKEESKFGIQLTDVMEFMNDSLHELKNIKVRGLMGMATFTEDKKQVSREFSLLKSCFDTIKKELNLEKFDILSMGMSGDFNEAIQKGSNMVRIGSSIFGTR